MDSVTIDGVEYVKASTLAKQLKYTADYIGQLCRGRKVDAHLVGRTWYVYPPSLEGHKSSRYAELRAPEKKPVKPQNIRSSRTNVIPALSKKTARVQTHNFENRIFWKAPKYEADEAALLPSMAKEPMVPRSMPIELAESEKVRVVSASRNVSMVSQPLPAVALSGTLKVLDYAPRFSVEQADKTVEKTRHVAPVLADKNVNAVQPSVYPKGGKADDSAVHKVVLRKAGGQETSPPVPASSKPVTNVVPKVPTAVSGSAPRGELMVPRAEHASFSDRFVIVPVLVLFIASIALAILSLESVTMVAADGEMGASLRLSTSLLQSVLNVF